MNEEYIVEFTVEDTECDAERRMLPGSLLRRTQQAGTDQCTAFGITPAVYEETHTGFLLAKLCVEIYAPIHIGDALVLKTVPYAPKHATLPRVTRFYAKGSDKLLAMVDARWVLVNTETKRILRVLPPEIAMQYGENPPELEVRVPKVAEAPVVGQERAVYSRCDINHHLNNTMYADVICDNMPQGVLLQQPVSQLRIAYHNEIPLETHFHVLRAETGENEWYFAGVGEDGTQKYFEASLRVQAK